MLAASATPTTELARSSISSPQNSGWFSSVTGFEVSMRSPNGEPSRAADSRRPEQSMMLALGGSTEFRRFTSCRPLLGAPEIVSTKARDRGDTR